MANKKRKKKYKYVGGFGFVAPCALSVGGNGAAENFFMILLI